jgi:hypothetical protein
VVLVLTDGGPAGRGVAPRLDRADRRPVEEDRQ